MSRPVRCRRGASCNFAVKFNAGLDAAYTDATFVVRNDFDPSLPALLEITSADMVFDRVSTPNRVNVLIGATVTDTLPVVEEPRLVAALFTLINPTDDDDRKSFKIPFEIQPRV